MPPCAAHRTGIGAGRSLLHDLRFVYKFEYQAEFGTTGSEHELCSVYLARTTGTPVVNTTEIDDWQWIAGPELNGASRKARMSTRPGCASSGRGFESAHADALPARAGRLPT